MKKALKYLTLGLVACTTPIEVEVRGTADALVIDASITNEFKQHKVVLAKAIGLDESEPLFVSGATVWIEESSNARYDFSENEAGLYISDQAFSAVSGSSYTLHILTEGKEYISTPEELPSPVQIDALFGEYVINPSTEEEGSDEGIQFFVNASTTDASSEVFNVRIEYDEDYMVRVPYESPYVYTVDGGIQPREIPIQTCYNNIPSTELIIGSTGGQSANVLLDLPISFVRPNEAKLRLRYALSVRQYSISPEAYRYYQDLKEINEFSGGFADRQKGSIIGNIVNVGDQNETILGYFEVAHYAERREFFDPATWRDEGFLPGELFLSCEYSSVADSVLTMDVQNNLVPFGRRNIYAISMSGVYTILVPEACSDCRFYGNLEKPDFWE